MVAHPTPLAMVAANGGNLLLSFAMTTSSAAELCGDVVFYLNHIAGIFGPLLSDGRIA
jgi:hypothetical protein